jgi:hypothetical protein
MKPSSSLKFLKYPELLLLLFLFFLKYPNPVILLILKISNTQNQWFFHSVFFSEYSEHMGITKKIKYPLPTLVFFCPQQQFLKPTNGTLNMFP